MSFLTQERSRQDGEPVELYEIVRGDTVWRFTSNQFDRNMLTAVFSKTYLMRNAVKRTQDITKGTVNISLHRSNPVAESFLVGNPTQPTRVTIYRGHVTDPVQEYTVLWKGVVSAVSSEGNQLTLECNSVYAQVASVGLRAKFELTCRHTLYGSGCRLAKETFEFTATVSSTDSTSTILTLNDLVAKPDGFFAGGMMFVNFVPYHIIAHSGQTLTLFAPLPGIAGTLVKIHPGCDHTVATCDSKFNNVLNFGGFPWIPSKNPMAGSPVV